MTMYLLPTSVNKPLENIVEHDSVRVNDDKIDRPKFDFDE